MKTVLKVLGFLVLAIVVLIGAGAAFLAFKKPAMRPPSTEKIEATPERLARGTYLVNHVSNCVDEFSGGWEMRGPWGRVVTANITPDPEAYLGKATREEFIGRFKAFVDQEGEKAPIAPPGLNTLMNWGAFAGLTNEDLGAIYDYLKTVKPISNKVVVHPDASKSGG